MKCYPAGLNMFGESDTTHQPCYIELGPGKTPNEELRRQFHREGDGYLRKLDLEILDPTANPNYR